MKMKKINKKGFTLIELLVVIVILVVIMAVAIPSVTSSIERSKDKQLTQVKNLVTSAAELYYDSNKNSLGTNFPITVKIETLISNGYLTPAEAKDPFHEKRTVCGHVVIENKNSFKFIDSTCNAACNSGEECVAMTS